MGKLMLFRYRFGGGEQIQEIFINPDKIETAEDAITAGETEIKLVSKRQITVLGDLDTVAARINREYGKRDE